MNRKDFKFNQNKTHGFSFRRKESAGFTLIELLVAISILAIISVIGLTTYSSAQVVARDARRQQDLKSVQTALEVYYQAQNPHAFPIRSTFSGPGSLETDLNPPTYINQMPTPPTNAANYQYKYNSDGTTFELCTALENPAASGNGIDSIHGICPAGLAHYFHLFNP